MTELLESQLAGQPEEGVFKVVQQHDWLENYTSTIKSCTCIEI